MSYLEEHYDEIFKKFSDEKLLNHCWKILSDSKNSHRKDLFDKHIPLEIRYKNIMNYGS